MKTVYVKSCEGGALDFESTFYNPHVNCIIRHNTDTGLISTATKVSIEPFLYAYEDFSTFNTDIRLCHRWNVKTIYKGKESFAEWVVPVNEKKYTYREVGKHFVEKRK